MQKITRTVAVLALLATLVSAGALAQQKGRIEPAVAKANATKAVQEIAWFSNLQSAQQVAQKEGKLVLWMHMLGNIFSDTWSAANSLRAVSLSHDPSFSLLKDRFVCGVRDITGEPWSGFSGIHPIDGGAVHTTNGAGPHNIQIFILSPDGTVLTCLPGYWNSEDLAHELEFAQELNKVWTDASLTKSEKDAKYTSMHLEHIANHPRTMVKRSQMQGFDKKFEEKRLDTTDTVLLKSGPKGMPVFKTTDVIMHERLAKQPFKSYKEFDVVAFSDYGRAKYDKNEEGGQKAVDTRPQTLAKKKAAQEARQKQIMEKRKRRNGNG